MTRLERRRMNRARLLGDRLRLRRRVAELELRACAPWQIGAMAQWNHRLAIVDSRLAMVDRIARGEP